MRGPLALLQCVLLLSLLSFSRAQDDVEVRIGELSDVGGHSVAGTVYALNSRQLRIKGLEYDGEGPAAVFWTGNGNRPDGSGVGVPFRDDCSFSSQLPGYSGDTVDLELPDGKTLADVDYISIWCEQIGVDFGNVAIDASALEGVPDLPRPACDGDGPAPAEAEEAFPVQEGWNCEELNENFQARWIVDGDNVNVELVGRIGENRYMGFGVSGSDDRTNMDGSDVAIAYRNGESFEAVDFFMEGRFPCTNGEGVCPDEDLEPNSGTNDFSGVSGESKGDLTKVLYSRSLTAADAVADRPISTSGPTFITWALGPLNPDSLLPLFHGETTFPRTNVSIEFGRAPQNACTNKLVVMEEDEPVPGFIRPTISNMTEITARIGPPAGSRGYAGITAGASWGFAWYMSPTGSTGQDILIPAIAVERGKTYTFTVQGGVENDDGVAFHPLYITDSAMGGYAGRDPKQRAQENVYAGVEDIVTDENGAVTSFRATATGALCNIESSLTGDTASIETWDEYADTLDVSCAEDDSITSNAGKLTWTVPADAPGELFYQCITHPFLGYKLVVFDEGKVDLEKLETANGGGELVAEDVEGKECTVTFKGQTKTFSGCQKEGLDGNVEVYWTVGENDDEIETLFRAPTSGGYVGFGWGYTEMLGSNVAIAFQDKEGNAQIEDYFMGARTSEGVQPNNNQKLTAPDAAIDGEFVAGLFTRKLEADGIPKITIGRTPAIWAVGEKPTSATSLVQHGTRGRGEIDLSADSGGLNVISNRNFFIAHAALMLIAWLALTPAAVVIMTHLKGYNPAAFQVHRGLNVLSVLVVVIAYIMAVVRGSHEAKAHLALGTIVFIFALIQAVSGALRPHKGTPERKPWYLQHALLGHTALILAIANAMVGMRTTSVFDVGTGWYIAWGVLLGGYLLAHIVLFLLKPKLATPKTEDRPEESPA